MTDRKLFCTGAAGSVIAAICCFTPALVILLGAVGLSAWLAWLDFVLLPALAIFLGITAYAVVRMHRTRSAKSAAR
jgi:mercuric ion transport protein